MVTNIFEAHLVMLFTEGLTEPLQGWVKAYKPTSLQDAVSKARDLQESVPKPKFTPRQDTTTEGRYKTSTERLGRTATEGLDRQEQDG
jgi:hypothetical protein